MTRAIIDKICESLPGATWADPSEGELASWKVGGKMFACLAGEGQTGVAVKTDSIETAQMLIDAGAAEKARYFHRSWVALPFPVTEDEARHRIQVSYDLIVSKLPKKLRDTL